MLGDIYVHRSKAAGSFFERCLSSLRGKFYWHLFLSQYQSMRNSLNLYGILFPLKQSLKGVVQFETRYMNGKASRNVCGPRGTFDGNLYTHSIAPGSAKLRPTAPLRT